MLFNSLEYFIFLPVVFCLYWFVCNKTLKQQNCLLLAASYFFYSWWSWKFLFLLLLSTVLDYLYGFGVGSSNKKKARLFLGLSVLNNLGVLFFFKYYDFFISEFQKAAGWIGLPIHPVFVQIALPIGISFYTFHGMSYVFDIYRGIRKPVRDFVDYAVFISFFPLLVAGPIERAGHLLPQVQTKRFFNYKQVVEGCRLMLWGLFKKVVIADSLSIVVDDIFNHYRDHSAFSLIVAAIGFSFQIYTDFSGYSDIAIGTAKLFGMELFSNFRFPYFSRDIAEFWRRWHISLSSWFRDYLYIPLGGSRKGKLTAVRNVFIIFLVSGLWHGAGWNFVVWGAIHACGFLPLLLANRNRRYVSNVVAAGRMFPDFKETAQMVFTFGFATFAWIFFRVHDLKNGVGYVRRIILDSLQNPGQYFARPQGLSIFCYIIPFLIAEWQLRNNERILKVPVHSPKARWGLYYLIVLLILFLGASHTSRQFIYFKF